MKIVQSLLFTILVFHSNVFAGELSLIEKSVSKYLESSSKNLGLSEIIQRDPFAGNVEPLVTSSPEVRKHRFDFERTLTSSADQLHPFTVQISLSRSLTLSYRVAALLRQAKYPSFTSTMELKDTGVWHRIFIGAFATREAAQALKERLLKDEIAEGFIRFLPYAIQIGDTGSIEELETLRQIILQNSYLPYSTPVRLKKSGLIEGRLLVGAFSNEEDCSWLLDHLSAKGFYGTIIKK